MIAIPRQLPLIASALILFATSSAGLGTSAAQAQEAAASAQAVEQFTDYPPLIEGRSGLSRAEVQADQEIWQRAGLSDLEKGEASADSQSDEYRARYARYQSLRDGPEYIQALHRHGGAVPVASTARRVRSN